MIVDDASRTLIVTPAKCGTVSLEGMATRQDGVWKTKNRHVVAAPEGREDYRRLMMCRDPWSRLTSVWSFVVRHYAFRTKDDQWDWAAEATFPEFATRWCEGRPAFAPPAEDRGWTQGVNLWWLTQGDYLDRWQPTGLVRMEHLAHDLAAHGLDYGEEMRRNTSDAVRPGNWVGYYDGGSWDVVSRTFAAADAARLGYPDGLPAGPLGELAASRVPTVRSR